MKQYDEETIYKQITLAQKGDDDAKSFLVQENLGLVYSVSKRFYNRGYEKEDVHQVGIIGLLKAIKNFDISFGVRFSTYAVPLIMGEIKRFLRDDGPIKVSRSLKHTAGEAMRITEDIEKKQGRTPGILEIAKIMEISPEEITNALEASVPPESFSAYLGDGNITLADVLPSKESEIDFLEKLDLESAVSSLSPREKNILLMRYYMDKTQSDVANKLGISQVQVSRLEKKILMQIREKLS